MNTAQKLAQARADAEKDGLPEAPAARRAYVKMERRLEAAERGRANAEERAREVIHRRLEMLDQALIAAEERARVAAAAIERLDRLTARLADIEREMRDPQRRAMPLETAPAGLAPSDEVPGGATVLNGVAAIARAIGIGRRQAYHWIEKHGLPVFRVGSTICARRPSLNAWLAEQEAKPRTLQLKAEAADRELKPEPGLTVRRGRGRPPGRRAGPNGQLGSPKLRMQSRDEV